MAETLSKLSSEVMAANTRPEIQLLLCCARTSMDGETAEKIKTLLQSDIDWAYVIQHALQHRVMPLLYWSLRATCSEGVPKPILDQLHSHFSANTVRNLSLVRELLNLISRLEEQGIPAIPYKGPMLAASVYGNFALRQSGDLDILVRQQDAVRAKDLLLSMGYRMQYQPSAVYEALFRHFRRTYDMVSEDSQVFVELHWNIISWPISPSPNAEVLWEHLEFVPLADKTVRNLVAEDVLPVLCIHGAKHHWERLGWICDVAELLRANPGIHWDRVMEQASRLGGPRMVSLGLLLAQSLLGAPVPEAILRRLQRDLIVASLAARVQARLFASRDDLLWALEQHTFYLRLGERVRDRIWCGIFLVPRMVARVVYYVIAPHPWWHS